MLAATASPKASDERERLPVAKACKAIRGMPVLLRRICNRTAAGADQFRASRPLRRIRSALDDAEALEIGGPSALFARGRPLALYGRLQALDELDFAADTLWTGALDSPVGLRQRLIGEAAELNGVPDASYDAVLVSHVLEHLANPLRALRRWRAVLRAGGHVLLVVPHRDGTFDHRRPITPLDHLLDDERRGIGEDDQTHVEEVLALHDFERDPVPGGRGAFAVRARDNLKHRGLHHHVFSTASAVDVVRAAGLAPVEAVAMRPYHAIVLARRDPPPELSDGDLALRLTASPFPTDRDQAAERTSAA